MKKLKRLKNVLNVNMIFLSKTCNLITGFLIFIKKYVIINYKKIEK